MDKYKLKTIAIMAAVLFAPLSLSASESAKNAASKNVDISKIDKNFAAAKIDAPKPVFKNALETPFVLEGFPWLAENGGELYRIPKTTTVEETNKGVVYLASNTAGGVVRFRTDSPFLVLRARLTDPNFRVGHMPDTGASGFDLFCNSAKVYLATVNPAKTLKKNSDVIEAQLVNFKKSQMRDYTLYLPLYNGVKTLEIGVSADAKILPPPEHKVKKPVLFYGSSITQGACASRPANAYTAMLCRAVDAPMINLGFSGSARGEKKMAELIASLDMSVFVFDYDHNAPSLEHLQKTHEPFFKIIRKAHPDLPIIILGKIIPAPHPRDNVLKTTYENAVKAGDKKVWYIPSKQLMNGLDFAYFTVDNCHPTDLGFYFMFKNTLPVLKEALNSK